MCLKKMLLLICMLICGIDLQAQSYIQLDEGGDITIVIDSIKGNADQICRYARSFVATNSKILAAKENLYDAEHKTFQMQASYHLNVKASIASFPVTRMSENYNAVFEAKDGKFRMKISSSLFDFNMGGERKYGHNYKMAINTANNAEEFKTEREDYFSALAKAIAYYIEDKVADENF